MPATGARLGRETDDVRPLGDAAVALYRGEQRPPACHPELRVCRPLGGAHLVEEVGELRSDPRVRPALHPV